MFHHWIVFFYGVIGISLYCWVLSEAIRHPADAPNFMRWGWTLTFAWPLVLFLALTAPKASKR